MNKTDDTSFTKEDVALMSIFAYQAAMDIENARLYEDLGKAEEKYRSIFENAVEATIRRSSWCRSPANSP